jgi:hypothetical protein
LVHVWAASASMGVVRRVEGKECKGREGRENWARKEEK